jgi:hypothetical protein
MRPPSHRTAARAVPLCLLVGITAAQVVRSDDVRIEFDGVTFALEVASSDAPGWRPAAADWLPTDRTWTVDLTDQATDPGAPVDVRVAVRNVSGTPATVALWLADPDPVADDLFDALQVTVSEAGRTLATGSAANLRVSLPEPVGPHGADERVLDVRVDAPDDDRWTDVRTGLELVLAGTSR